MQYLIGANSDVLTTGSPHYGKFVVFATQFLLFGDATDCY